MLRPREENKRIHNKRNIKKEAFRARVIITTALVLWGMAAINLCVSTWKTYTNKEDVVNAFTDVIYSELTADISANGYYGNMELSETAKYIILEEIADRIGINRYNIVSDEDGSTILSQTSVNGNVVLKLITVCQTVAGQSVGEKQYLCMDIKLNQTIGAADTYRNILEEVIKDYGMDTNVNVNLSGSVSGRMNLLDMQGMKETLMGEIGGSVKAEKNTEDIYTVYGYDKDIEHYITMGKEKVNVNITMAYDEIHDRTMISLATPINNQDY